ncbi:putative membrane protein [Motilibacter rhizosphaerae]|uniref:Putative membrane protein n=1 Tax=Motilibacter rhizosphaerae TaxID=598652 RepID=A0A4Q7NPS6_9ACTN|nr:TMEM175 family protein [Motilibacter rhizosphaerae]RZS87324.1 putative membrane protein [Motilibacter rhizosphaerae]
MPAASTSRVEAFSDGVFAIAITLLVLEIRVPEDTRHLAHGLLDLWPSYLAFGVSFLLVGLVWANHHVMFEHIRAADRPLLFLNTLLLMNVSFLPFAAAVLAAALRDGHGERTAVVLYGGTLVVGGVFFNAIWEWARRGHQLLGTSIDPAGARAVSRRFLLGPALYAAGTALGAAVPLLGLLVFAALIVFYWLPVTAR